MCLPPTILPSAKKKPSEADLTLVMFYTINLNTCNPALQLSTELGTRLQPSADFLPSAAMV
jgi:hypothetical protein